MSQRRLKPHIINIVPLNSRHHISSFLTVLTRDPESRATHIVRSNERGSLTVRSRRVDVFAGEAAAYREAGLPPPPPRPKRK
jgi:hypothetical protein